MIKRLILKNYRVYKNLDMEFENLQIIKGRNGIGKTSIVEAIGFALFGSTMQRGKAKEWIKQGEKDGGVSLYLDDYIIHRSNNMAIVETLDGKIIARNNVGIVEWVEKEYGLTADLYRTSFYIGQKDIGAFAALAPLERTKRVEKLLRIDRLDEIKNQAKDIARAVQGNLNAYVSKLENSFFKAKILDDSQHLAEQLRMNLSSLEPEYEKLLIASGEYNQQLKNWDVKQRLLRQFTGEVEDLEQLEKDYLVMVERNAKIDAYNLIVREKSLILENLKGVTILEKYFNYNLIDVMNHEMNLKKYNLLNNEFDKLDCLPFEHDIPSRKAELKELEKTYDLNKNIPINCPTCKQSWPTKSVVNLDNLLDKISYMEISLSQDQRENRAWEIKNEMPTIEMLEEEIKVAKDSLEYKNGYLRLKEIGEDHNKRKDKEVFHIDMVLAREQNILAEKLRELEDVTEPERIDLKPIRDEIRAAKAKAAGTQAIIRKQMEYKAIEEEFNELRNNADEHLEELKAFIKFIDQYRKAFGANIIPLLEENVSNIVSYLSEGKYEKIKINNNYSIDNFDYYSGSEQDSINFALRLAIAQVSKLGNFNTMLLDEIAASFDAEREKLLMDILKQQSNQLIYITHGNL